jgi:DNA-directed RNA polymerase subunit E'/Rpb7
VHRIVSGRVEAVSLNGDVRYDVQYFASVCNPPVGSVLPARVVNLNRFGVLTHSGIQQPDGTFVAVVESIITKQALGLPSEVDLETLSVGDNVFVEIVGKKFELDDEKISVIGRVVMQQKSSHKATAVASAADAFGLLVGDGEADGDDDVSMDGEGEPDADGDPDADADADADGDGDDEDADADADAGTESKKATKKKKEAKKKADADDEDAEDDDDDDDDAEASEDAASASDDGWSDVASAEADAEADPDADDVDADGMLIDEVRGGGGMNDGHVIHH